VPPRLSDGSYPGNVTSELAALDRGMARGIAAFRGLALGWAWIGLVLEREHLDRPWPAVGALAAATVLTLWLVVVIAHRAGTVFGTTLIGGELLLGVGLLLVDGLVYDAMREQSLPWAWPAAAIITAAIAGGIRWGLATSAVVAGASIVGESLLRGAPEWTTGAASKSALFALAGVAAGTVAQRLRDAEQEISLARSREETARVLHDGVLQTLAVITRRSTDESLRSLAAEQERELRAYVSAIRPNTPPLAIALGNTVETVRRRLGLTTELIVAQDVPELSDVSVIALVGAVGEALNNAANHSGADRVVVFVEPDDGDDSVFCSVRDNGTGFEPADARSGSGLQHSIRNRIEEIGGRVEIDTKVGRGTEVRMWVS